MASELTVSIENFDGFAILRPVTKSLEEQHLDDYMRAAHQLAASGESLIFFDFGKTSVLSDSLMTALQREIGSLKTQHKIEIVLLSEPTAAAQLQASPLAQHCQLFERKQDRARRLLTRRVLSENHAVLRDQLEATLDGAIQTGVQRWIGQLPLKVAAAPLNVNPATDVISVVEMNIDGCVFRVFLSASQNTLRQMVTQILKQKIIDGDPAIPDGACELLNYLTAFFRERLTSLESVVETFAPQLLEPDEMMVMLNLDVPAQRVQTQFGSFDVWLEAAA